MLVLSRCVGERILVDGGRVVIQLLETHGHRAKIGVQASPEIRVDREEVAALRERNKRRVA
jgi:carbon storage regulator CsrA